MSTSPISQHPPPFSPRNPSRSLPSSRPQSRSSSIESRPRGRTPYSHYRNPSQDSLYLYMDSSCGPIQRWDGLAREATDWNSLRRDPELYLPIGNCLVFLYAGGSSQRGPSFRIPYDLLLYSGCRPLIDRCLITSGTSEYHPASSTPPSYDTMDYPMSEEENCCFLHLPAPAGLSRDESYVYHLTTRNFFAWLLGVPLVGTDPISALLDLKIRMDMWRDPGSGNLGALFDYVKEQGYGDFEALEIEMGKRLNADTLEANSTMAFPPTSPMMFTGPSGARDEDKSSRRNSLTERIRRKLSRSRIRENELPASMTQGPSNVETRLQVSRMNSYTYGPPPPPADYISAAMQRLVGPASTQSIDTASNPQDGREEKRKKRQSWTSIAGNAWKRASMADVRLPSLQTQRLEPVGSSAVEGPYMPAPVSAQAVSAEATFVPPPKRKRRLSWKRAPATDIKLSPLQTQQPQSAISSATHRPTPAPGPVSDHSPQSAPASSSVSGEEKKKRRLSWANVSDKIFDIMMPPISKDDLSEPTPSSQEKDTSTTNNAAELPSTEVAAAAAAAAASSSSAAAAAGALSATEAKPVSFPPAGGSTTRSSSRHPSIHDFSTGQEICTCCGKARQPRPEPSAGPSQPAPSDVQAVKKVKEVTHSRGAFETLHDHMKARRDKFRFRPHKETVVPEYGNRVIGLSMDARKRKTTPTAADVFAVKLRPKSKDQPADAGKTKTRSDDAIASSPDARKAKTRSRGKAVSVDTGFAPTDGPTKESKRLKDLPDDTVVSSTNLRPETSVAVLAGPTLATEFVASPTTLPGLSASPSSLESSPAQDCTRSSRSASLGYAQQTVSGVEPAVVVANSGKGTVPGIYDGHYQGPPAREPAPNSMCESGSAHLETGSLGQERGWEDNQFRVVNADFESNIEGLLAQLEAAGIGDKGTEMDKNKQKSLVDLEPRIGMPRLVHEVA